MINQKKCLATISSAMQIDSWVSILFLQILIQILHNDSKINYNESMNWRNTGREQFIRDFISQFSRNRLPINSISYSTQRTNNQDICLRKKSHKIPKHRLRRIKHDAAWILVRAGNVSEFPIRRFSSAAAQTFPPAFSKCLVPLLFSPLLLPSPLPLLLRRSCLRITTSVSSLYVTEILNISPLRQVFSPHTRIFSQHVLS